MIFFFLICFVGVQAAEYTLPGVCPKVDAQKNLDYTRFSGVWYVVASYASDGRPTYDCNTFEFQEDNLGYILKESFIEVDQGNRTQKTYQARVDPTFDAGNTAQFIVSVEAGDNVIQLPFYVLSTDYDGYAIAYTCKWLKKDPKHYVFTWIATRSKASLQGEMLKKVEGVLAKYPDLSGHRQSFVFKDFSEASCSYTKKMLTDFFSTNFW